MADFTIGNVTVTDASDIAAAQLQAEAAFLQQYEDEAAGQAALGRAYNLKELRETAAAEIAYLTTTIPTIDTMTLAQVRAVVKRLCQENLAIIKAIRWLAKNGQ